MNIQQLKRTFGLRALALGLSLAAVSCTLDDATQFETIELGAEKSEYLVESTSGSVDISVFANRSYTIAILGDVSWARSRASTLTGDTHFTVDFDTNSSFPRMARVLLTATESRRDTVYIKQKGVLTPALNFPNPHATIPGSKAMTVNTPLQSNIPFTDLDLTTRYTSDDDGNWISTITYQDGQLRFETTANPDQAEPRTAHITLTFTDGLGDRLSATLYLTQTNAKDALGQQSSFEELRARCTSDEPVDLTSSILIDGWVVSDNDGGNMGINPQTTESTIDYLGCRKTAYIESLDGKYGFMVQVVNESDNQFTRYSKVRLLLKGATITREQTPERYTLSGVTHTMIASSEQGTASQLPAKKMRIGNLTDNDLYTYITLEACELPIRKGPLTPLNEGYTNATNANRTDKFASLVRDIEGSSIYLYTNTTCRYRRDGSRLPYGSGSLSGVVVHELMPRYEYKDNTSGNDDTYGNIGRYQLRHVSKSDFQLNDDFKESFSALLTEYRFIQYDNNKLKPTYGVNGYLTHSYKDPSGAIKIISNEDFSYLGPVGSNDSYYFGKNIGNLNGLGIILEDGTDWYADNKSVNSATTSDTAGAGKGKCPTTSGTVGPAWVDWYWWDKAKERGHAWILNFSTAGIATDQLSMQISVLNNRNTSPNYSGPRYFKVEWSTTGNMDKDSDWSYIGSYTVPDITQWSPATRYWQCAGFKPLNFRLPLEMLGKDNVFIRMQVTKNVAGDLEGYDNTVINSPSCMNYLAIRYNK